MIGGVQVDADTAPFTGSVPEDGLRTVDSGADPLRCTFAVWVVPSYLKNESLSLARCTISCTSCIANWERWTPDVNKQRGVCVSDTVTLSKFCRCRQIDVRLAYY